MQTWHTRIPANFHTRKAQGSDYLTTQVRTKKQITRGENRRPTWTLVIWNARQAVRQALLRPHAVPLMGQRKPTNLRRRYALAPCPRPSRRCFPLTSQVDMMPCGPLLHGVVMLWAGFRSISLSWMQAGRHALLEEERRISRGYTSIR